MAKIIISLSDALLVVVDKYCKNYKYNRSEFVRHAMREVLRKDSYEDTVENKKTN